MDINKEKPKKKKKKRIVGFLRDDINKMSFYKVKHINIFLRLRCV